jgi:hypothetical protein
VKKHHFSLVLAVSVALLAATPAFPAARTWNGSQGNDHWTNTGNWSPASAVANDGMAYIILRGFSAGRRTVNRPVLPC